MRYLIIIFSFIFLLNCKGQDTTFISSIERKVYLKDSIISKTIVHFDTSDIFLLRSQEILRVIENDRKKENITVSDTSIVYNFFLSDETKKNINLFTPHIDNLIRIEGGVDGDQTFEVNWWYRDDEIETIIIPSSEFHK